ncbi:peptidase M28-like protein [Flavobacteriaceae bacterium MAR_2009_75]|nr:peptidase M28-like protein [Flavobacteriaceae bacterium MAR_2009_75]
MRKILCSLLLFNLCSVFSQSEITTDELYDHISFLTSTVNKGRYPGSSTNKKLVKYISKDFKNSGLEKFDQSYRQEFVAELRVSKYVDKKPEVKTWNVIGLLKGNDPKLQNEYIVLGAHYDHLGHGGPSSKSDQLDTVHPGADDNASGTAALLEIAERLSSIQSQLKRSIIFVAFGAEEQGLLGSKHFVENSPVPLAQLKLMINMDMVGRLNEQKQIYMGGAGTFPEGQKLMAELGKEAGLNPVVHAGSVGGSDHVSFYKKNISVLGMHTGGHKQYHTPEDTIDLINFNGEKMVCDYIFQTIFTLASSAHRLKFIAQD